MQVVALEPKGKHSPESASDVSNPAARIVPDAAVEGAAVPLVSAAHGKLHSWHCQVGQSCTSGTCKVMTGNLHSAAQK